MLTLAFQPLQLFHDGGLLGELVSLVLNSRAGVNLSLAEAVIASTF